MNKRKNTVSCYINQINDINKVVIFNRELETLIEDRIKTTIQISIDNPNNRSSVETACS